jgi:hypothetical protein
MEYCLWITNNIGNLACYTCICNYRSEELEGVGVLMGLQEHKERRDHPNMQRWRAIKTERRITTTTTPIQTLLLHPAERAGDN